MRGSRAPRCPAWSASFRWGASAPCSSCQQPAPLHRGNVRRVLCAWWTASRRNMTRPVLACLLPAEQPQQRHRLCAATGVHAGQQRHGAADLPSGTPAAPGLAAVRQIGLSGGQLATSIAGGRRRHFGRRDGRRHHRRGLGATASTAASDLAAVPWAAGYGLAPTPQHPPTGRVPRATRCWAGWTHRTADGGAGAGHRCASSRTCRTTRC